MAARDGRWRYLRDGCGGHRVEGGDGMVTNGGLTLLYVVVGVIAVIAVYRMEKRRGKE